MKFAAPIWLFGTGLALIVGLLLILAGIGLVRAIRRFGDEDRVRALTSQRAAGRRALKGSLLVVAMACLFVAAAQPQYGRGTRKIPATNLDVVVVLDYSKSMYAQDVAPSRTERAKAEVARLVQELQGARFGAVAFAGEPLAFPLTSDGAAIAQFFRQLTPNDMPIGGTAIARALEAARGLFARDPLSNKHEKVIVLVTDGEDLEGDPVSVANSAASEKVAIHVVQIGGRTPEPLPQVSDQGVVVGLRQDRRGRPLTTSLSAEGEKQLAQIAEVSGGNVVRSEAGDTKIALVTAALKRLMTQELSEQVETVYADVYAYPLGLAIALLVLETFVSQVRRPRRRRKKAARRSVRGESRASESATIARPALGAFVLIALTSSLAGCDESLGDPQQGVFSRYSPVVDQAVSAITTSDAGMARSLLSDYLNTGKCRDGQLDTGSAPDYPAAAFDFGLTLFQLGELYGERFGKETPEQPVPEARERYINCARSLLEMIARRLDVPLPLRARVHYLMGNLEFLRKHYADAVALYDQCLKLSPAEPGADGAGGSKAPGADPIGADCAHNRAIALTREDEEKKDQQPADGGTGDPSSSPDAGANQPPEQQPDAGGGQPDSNQQDPEEQDPDQKDDQNDQDPSKQEEPPPEPEKADEGSKDSEQEEQQQQQAQQEPSPEHPSPSQDERMLDLLEDAPTLQQEAARRRRGKVQQRMEDK